MTDYERIKREFDLSMFEKKRFLDKAWPVGSIYMSLDATDPSVHFGGTWERIQDTFLLAAGGAHPAGQTGGEERHTLTSGEMPSHYHTDILCNIGQKLTPIYGAGATGMGGISVNSGNPDYKYYTGHAGGDQPHNNMPPYISVYMWRRTR